MNYNQRWAYGVGQFGANALMPLGDVFHFDPCLATNSRASSISAHVGVLMIRLPSAFGSLGKLNKLFTSHAPNDTTTLSILT